MRADDMTITWCNPDGRELENEWFRPIEEEITVQAVFSVDEMLAVREQYEERLQAAESRAEVLEWQLRHELVRLRETAGDVRQIEQRLNRLIGTMDDSSSSTETVARLPKLAAVA